MFEQLRESSGTVVGIKISTLASPLHVTHRAVIDAIAEGVASVGVVSANIIVWDRDPRRMRDSDWIPGPATTTQPYRIVAVIGDSGWDPKSFYESKLVGKLIWGDFEFGREESLGTRSHLPNLLTQTITKLINVPVLQDHDACGLAGCLYNLSLGMVDNTRRFETLGQHGDPMIAEICAMPKLRGKLVLNVMDGLIAEYAGGPVAYPNFQLHHATIYASRDPVAIDAVALKKIDEWRKRASLPPLAQRAVHVEAAAQIGLGNANTDRIEIRNISP